ncbi:MAG TPA: aminotransferase class I/II-fold pyridoxal phosphate-dependent enzyme [Gemmatimonadaceae bacterium]|nr:aminotransferase class I/II-fold pyridoxal phosphate-dependent enzyme [Gemmatimonadaceae bacterium]
MAVSRREFLTSMGVGGAAVGVAGAGILTAPLISFRGRESLYAQGIADRKADRRLAAQPGMVRIDSNENPMGAGKHVYDAIRGHLDESNRYPVLAEDDLMDAIAAKQGVASSNVILGCGSGELLRAADHAFTSRDAAYIGAAPTFEAPGEFAKFVGAAVTLVPVDGHLGLDLDAMAAAARGAGLVYLCNPNNPTATVHSKSDVVAFIETVNRTSPGTTVLVDEAYFEYVDRPDYGTVIPLALTNPRVVVLRTFSKVFGLAGLRIGYAVGRPDVLARMKSWTLGSNVSQLSLIAAKAALEDRAHVTTEVRRNGDVKAFTRKFFADAGFTMSAGDGNFMMVDIRRPAGEFKATCLRKGVAVGRAFPSLPNHARITFGTMPEMRKALAVFRDVLGTGAGVTGAGRTGSR